jgi:[protein-PII] uridylyltransferase
LGDNRKQLIKRFLEGKERDFFTHNAEIIDDYFREVFAASDVGPRIRVDKNPYAIVALGGYGRKEQCICSDVDVMLLFRKRIPEEGRDLVQEIFYPLWDTGLEVGHATRSSKECASLAAQDFEVLTSLLDGRFVCGISSVYSELMDKLRRKVLRKNGRAYIRWLAERNEIRHDRFGDSTYLLEPNLKEGQGGLRDFHTILWTGRTTYALTEPRDLEFMGHLSHDEFHTLEKALHFIRTVRNWLHHLTGRKCDQLYFEHQIGLAKSLGFVDKNGQQAVENFLSLLHKQMEFVKRQHLIFLDKVLKAKKRTWMKGTRRSVSPGLVLANGSLHFESPEAILKNPRLLIKIFEKSAVLKKPLCDQAGRLVQEFLFLIDEPFRKSRPVITSLKKILAAPPRSFNVLYEMLNTGILVALIPEMRDIVNLIQYDEYHLYPVDKHSLRTVQALKELRDAGPEEANAFYAEVFGELDQPDLLLWAGLFHDIGKGRTQHDLEEHGEVGAKIAERVFARMGFPAKDIDMIAYLVREHLSLIHTATRRDIYDEKTIVDCARKIGDVPHLRMLYLLTVSDSKSTGPKAWNDWKEALLKELFFKVYNMLKKEDLGSPASEKIVEAKKKKVLETKTSIPKENLQNLFEQLSPRYLLYTPAPDIIRHIELFQTLGKQPAVLEVEADPITNARKITICARDFPGLFSKLSGVFTLHGLNVLSAQIYTWRNQIALDIFELEAPLDAYHEEEKWTRVRKDLKAVLTGKISLSEALEEKMNVPLSRHKTHVDDDRVVVDNQASDFFTLIEVYTQDSPGLLYRITDTLFKCELDIWIARIGTKADQVVDVFYVRDFDGQKVEGDQQINSIKNAVKEVLKEMGSHA